MPIYEYRCDNCGHELETIQKLSEAPLTVCPACNEATLRKQISAAGFRLKGSGWYETDFKSGNKKNVARGDDSSGSATGGSDGAKGGDKSGAAASAGPAATGADSKPAKSRESGSSTSSAAAD